MAYMLAVNVSILPSLSDCVPLCSDQIGDAASLENTYRSGEGKQDGDDLLGAVRLLEEAENGGFARWDAVVHDGEARVAVPDPDLVGVGGGEEEPNGEKEGSGGGGIGRDAHVLHPHLLQIELRLLRLHG